MSAMRSERGFSLLEILIATAIMVGITGVIFSLVNPAKGAYRTQPEVSDMQQRLRVVSTLMSADLILAGAGAPVDSALRGSLLDFLAPVQPYRMGRVGADPAMNVFYRENAISVLYVPANAAQTSIRVSTSATASELRVNAQPGCSGGAPLCGFAPGARAIVFDERGFYDPFTVTAVSGNGANGRLEHALETPLSVDYPVDAQVAAVVQASYYLDPATNQLMYYDGGDRDEPIASDIVDLRFRYFGESRPPVLLKPLTDLEGPWTSYGPKPPPLGAESPGWPAGENCTFVVDANGQHVSRLGDLGVATQGLVELTAAMLTDGPWCPSAGAANRYDADLLRVRTIEVRLRVQVASAALRGPAGPLFSKGGTAPGGAALVPDQEIRFNISPRNFSLGR